MGKPRTVTLRLDELTRDPMFQMRTGGVNEEHAADLKDALDRGVSLPAPIAYKLPDQRNVVTDGFHTCRAHELAGREILSVELREGTIRDAILASTAANPGHGLRRTNGDKRRAVEVCLNTLAETGERWTDQEVADWCCVGRWLVSDVRKALACRSGSAESARTEPEPSETPTVVIEEAEGFEKELWDAAEEFMEGMAAPVRADSARPPAVLDRKGRPIPAPLVDSWNEGRDFYRKARAAVLGMLADCKTATDHPYAKHLRVDEIGQAVERITDILKVFTPFVVCPHIDDAGDHIPAGSYASKCKWCRGANFIPEGVYPQLTVELRKIAESYAEGEAA